MKKIGKYLISLVFVIMVFIPANALAATEVTTYEELTTAISNGGEIKLNFDCDLTVTDDLNFEKNTTLDLNGKNLIMDGKTFYVLADLTLKDTSSEKTGAIKNTASSKVNLIQVGGDGNDDAINGNLTFESGTITAVGGNNVINHYAGKITLNGGTINSTVDGKNAIILRRDSTLIMNSGIIKSAGYGIISLANTNVVINGGLIEAEGFPLCGYGTDLGNGAKFEINGGTLTSFNATAQAIYLPQMNGETKITGGTFNGSSAIEIRAGKLDITGGTFNATATPITSGANGGGSTTRGAGLSIAQHTTKSSIEVNISGGIFNAYVPVNEANPQKNSAEDIAKIKLNVTGGTFNTTNDGTKASSSEDLTKFISGGTYTVMPSTSLIADGYMAYKTNDKYVVDKKTTMKANNTDIVVKKGESIDTNITFDGPGKDYVTYDIKNSDIVSVKNGKINGLKEGNTTITVKLNDLDNTTLTLNVLVYNVENKDKTTESNETYVSNIVKKVLEGSTTIKGISEEVIKNIKTAVLNNETIFTEVSINGIKNDISDSDKKIINNVLTENENVSEYYDIDFSLKTTSQELGNVTELDDSITISFDIPSNLPALKENYTRTYYIIRIHDNEATRIETKIVDDKIVFETDKFSTYALTYADKLNTKTNPQTGDNIINYMIIMLISVVGFVGSTKYLKKYKIVKHN